RRRGRRTDLARPGAVGRGSAAHNKDLTFIVYRVCFNEHYSESHRGCAVQISHACLACPYKGVISRRGRRTPNHSTHVVNTKSSAGVSTGEHPEILHSSGLSPQKRPPAT